MSLSEVFDHGAVIPWANFRFNNVSIDGLQTTIVPSPSTGGPLGNITRLIAKGTLRFTTSPVIVYTFSLPVTSSNPNGVFNVRFITLFKGGPSGNTNNGFYQETLSYGITTSNVTSTQIAYGNQFTNINLFNPGVVGQTISAGSNGFILGVHNDNVGHTTDVMWYVEVS